jgi:hypothetical protein
MKSSLAWPPKWQPEATEAATPYVDTDYLVDFLVGDPSVSSRGTRYEGHIYETDDGRLEVIHDRSGRPDVYPWSLPPGPVLRMSVRLPKTRSTVVFQHPDWTPPARS